MPHRETPPLGAPCWADLTTSDAERSKAFYGELFGWTAEVGGPEYGGYITFSKDGAPVAGCMPVDPSSGVPNVWVIYLASEDARATVATAVAHGATVHVEPMDVPGAGTMALVVDAGGAAIGIWQPAEHKGFTVLAEPGTPSWFELHTRDYERSVAFYRDVFGWDTHAMSDTPDFRYTTFGEGDGALAGIMDATAFLPAELPPHWSVYWTVTDADETLARVKDLGGSVVAPAEDTPYGRLATATDATGALFKIVAG